MACKRCSGDHETRECKTAWHRLWKGQPVVSLRIRWEPQGTTGEILLPVWPKTFAKVEALFLELCRTHGEDGPALAPGEAASAPLDLNAIESRATAARPGPWHEDGSGDVLGPTLPDEDPDNREARLIFESDPSARFDPANSRFAAAAREDVPALVRLVRAWEAFYRARDAYHRHSMTDEWNAYEAARAALVAAGGPADLARDE